MDGNILHSVSTIILDAAKRVDQVSGDLVMGGTCNFKYDYEYPA